MSEKCPCGQHWQLISRSPNTDQAHILRACLVCDYADLLDGDDPLTTLRGPDFRYAR